MSKKNLSKKPFVYSSAKELWENYARDKFYPLETTSTIDHYYDFIFATGAVGYWLSKEKNEPYTKDYQLFKSIYNNSKHYKLDDRGKYSEHVVGNYHLNDSVDENDNVLWNDDRVWNDDEPLIENEKDIIGENGATRFYCKTHDKETNTDGFIFLYEVCMRIFNFYENYFEQIF